MILTLKLWYKHKRNSTLFGRRKNINKFEFDFFRFLHFYCKTKLQLKHRFKVNRFEFSVRNKKENTWSLLSFPY